MNGFITLYKIHEKGKTEGKIEMVQNGIKQGIPLDILEKMSGLSKDEFNKILNNLNG